MDRQKILIVEDNPMNLELATDLLELAGYTIIHSENAEEAILMAKRESPDLVLMDINLPGMNGLEATKALKQDPTTRDIPVVALTAHAMKGDDEKIVAAGCAGRITKPINTRMFSTQVSQYISAPAQGGEDNEC
jgi:CheY-like chemotaxis protein